jgi:putative endonuclease
MPSLGAEGEAHAARFLKEQGFKLIKRNYKCPAGEVDIIAREGETLVFVEVKTRGGKGFGLPQESVDFRKQRRLVRAALFYLGGLSSQPLVRFDIVALCRIEGKFEVEHICDAFGMETH